MSKFLLNLLLQIFQALENSKFNFYSKRFISSDFSPLGSAGLPTPPALAYRLAQAVQPLPGPNRPAHLASQPLGPRVPLAYFAEDIFFFDSCLPFSVPSLSPLTDTWAPLVSSFVHPAPADPDCAATESCCIWPLRAAAPHLEMPPEPLLAPQSLPPLQVAP